MDLVQIMVQDHKDKDQTDHRDQIQMDLDQITVHVHKDQTKTDQMGLDQITVHVHKDQTDLVHRGQTKTGLVQIMMLDLRDLVKMDLDLKMETTHKKKTSKY
jgi:hypothetical protein